MLQFISSSARPIESRSNCFKLLPWLALSILIEARLLFRPVFDKFLLVLAFLIVQLGVLFCFTDANAIRHQLKIRVSSFLARAI